MIKINKKAISSVKKKEGITLIALVVTIVVLLILAGISISLVLGNNGLITKVIDARERTKKAEFDEKVDLAQNAYTANYLLNNESAYDELIKEITGYHYSYEPSEKVLKVYSNPDKTGYEKDVELREAVLEQVIDKNPGDITKDPITEESLEGTESNPYKIGFIEDLVGFAYEVNVKHNVYRGKYIELYDTLGFKNSNSYVDPNRTELIVAGETIWGGATQTYTLKQTMLGEDGGVGWNPIGQDPGYSDDNPNASHFSGIFEGNNKSLFDMYINTNDLEMVGLFGSCSDIIVQNLYIDGNVYGSGENLEYAGGIVGYSSGGKILNCISKVNFFNNEELNSWFYWGGIIGWSQALFSENGGEINNCDYYGEISILNATDGMGVGGISGISQWSMIDCENYGNITVKGVRNDTEIGGLVGEYCGGFSNLNEIFVNCVNKGTLDIEFKELNDDTNYVYVDIGGLIGELWADEEDSMSNCYNMGNISVKSVKGLYKGLYFRIGGLAGVLGSLMLNDNYNMGNIHIEDCQLLEGESDDRVVGGLAGLVENRGAIWTNSYNLGDIIIKDSNGIESVGGIAGENKGWSYRDESKDSIIKSSYNAGQITLDNSTVQNVGGIVGNNGEYGIIENCYYLKNDKVNIGIEGVAQNVNEVTNSGSKENEEEIYSNDFLINILGWDSAIWNISGTTHPTLISQE